MRPRSVLLAALLFTISAGCSHHSDPLEPVRQRIQSELKKGTPSISIAVSQGSHVVWQEAFGWANREREVRATPETMYTLASLSKPITATALMMLRDRGLISLDQSVNDYLGDQKIVAGVGNASEATVRRVAQHTAGLPGYYETFYPDETGKPPSMDEVIHRYGILMFPPGERFFYSNLDYAILGDVISHVSGETYDSFIRDEVFLPLGMNHSCVTTCPGLKDLEATRYRNGRPLPDYATPHTPASDDYSSASDLLRFAMFHMGIRDAGQAQILSDESVEQMQTQTVKDDGFSYGIGWMITQDRVGQERVGHGGSEAGVSTQLTFLPARQLAVAVLVNTFDDSDPDVAMQLADAVLDSLSGITPPNRWVTMIEGAKARLFREGFRPPPTLAGTWNGMVHADERSLPITIWINTSGSVQVQLGNHPKVDINNPQFRRGMFTGSSSGEIGTPDAARRHHSLEFDLVPRGDVLNGAVYAVGSPDSRGVRLGYWTTLKRRL